MKKIDIHSIDIKLLILNVFFTQFIILFVSFLLFYLLYRQSPVQALLSIMPNHLPSIFFYGLTFSIIVVTFDIIFSKKLPKEWMDDGGLNEKLFKDLPIWQIAIIALVVGFTEEFLFRGTIQPLLGIFPTSFLFTVIHFRYLKKVLLILVTFLISIGLGYLMIYSEWFTAFIAHFFIDFILGVLIRKKII